MAPGNLWPELYKTVLSVAPAIMSSQLVAPISSKNVIGGGGGNIHDTKNTKYGISIWAEFTTYKTD